MNLIFIHSRFKYTTPDTSLIDKLGERGNNDRFGIHFEVAP